MRCLFTIALLCLSSTSWASPALDQPYLLTGVAGPVVVYGVTPGAPVALLASATTNGPRYCPAAIAPTCADLRGTTYILATQRADAFGRTTFWVSAPPALHTVYLQAVAHEGGAFTLSPARAAPVLRGDRDADGDGLSNADELIAWGTSPAARDSDGDALDDGAEVMVWGTDPNNPDTDGGGVADGEEVLFQHTDPNAWYDDIDRWSRDSDGDGLYDGEEQDVWGTDAFNPDTDGGGVWDGEEVGRGSNPSDGSDDYPTYDSDNDGLYDSDEAAYGTDPYSWDTDGDGLGDGEEVYTWGTDPRLWDTDGGGVADGEEVLYQHTDPLWGYDDIDRWSRDSDGDGLYDGEEQDVWGTDPFSYDSDGDGLGDGDEVVTYATDPRLWDTDGGGVPDGEEIQRGTNPRDGWDD